MIIRKIQLKGDKKETAEVKLEKGLNLIVGGSDTGKSYICECIQFILGADIPEEIPQSKGYTSVEILFEEDNKEQFSLSRKLIKNSKVSFIRKNITVELNPHHKTQKNLSDTILKKCNLQNNVLASGLENFNHASLTLRVLEKIFIADENRIISKNSPLGSGVPMEKTMEHSLLKTLLTGIDDSEIKELKLSKKQNSNINTSNKEKIKNLTEFLENYLKINLENESDIEKIKIKINNTEDEYYKIKEKLKPIIGKSHALIEQRTILLNETQKSEENLINKNTLLNRFKLLQEKYTSDKERIEAISEAIITLEQHDTLNCPTCGNEVDEDFDFNENNTIESNSAEINKISKKQSELDEINSKINKEIVSLEKETTEKKEKLKAIDHEIFEQKKENIETLNNQLQEKNLEIFHLITLKNTINKRQKIKDEIESLKQEKTKIEKKYTLDNFDNELKSLLGEIQEILNRWDFPKPIEIGFDIAKRDYTISEKDRSSYGKGYRAITFSAFLVAMMNTLSQKGTHPGFVVLDSPLTSYKEGDKQADIEDEDEQTYIDNNMVYAIYRDLSDSYKDKQVIVFDNREPADDLIANMNYIHFTKTNLGRYGFFPVLSK